MPPAADEVEVSGLVPEPPASDGPKSESTKERKRRVLLAEDDPDMRRLLAARLRAAGHHVVEASDGVGIVDVIESMVWSEPPDAFDVIVSDVHMPGLSGLDVLAALRCSGLPTPVILITAFGDDDVHAEALELGAVAVLDKPIDPQALDAAVMQVVPRS
jgi:CheY-like chemotaxis protein